MKFLFVATEKPAGYYNENSADSIQKIIQEDFTAGHSAAEKCHNRVKKGGYDDSGNKPCIKSNCHGKNCV